MTNDSKSAERSELALDKAEERGAASTKMSGE